MVVESTTEQGAEVNDEQGDSKNWVGPAMASTAAGVTGVAMVYNIGEVTPFIREFGWAGLIVGLGLLLVYKVSMALLPITKKAIGSIADFHEGALEAGKQLAATSQQQQALMAKVVENQDTHRTILDNIHRAVERWNQSLATLESGQPK